MSRITDIPTPAVLVDAAILTGNLSKMQAAANARGLRLRPHAKTHKSPHVARLLLQLDQPAWDIRPLAARIS